MGFFDFNGDGKTSSFEYALGMTIMEEIMGDNNDTYIAPPHKKKKNKKLFEVPLPKLKENPTDSELKEHMSSLRYAIAFNIFFAVVTAVLLIVLFCSLPEITENNNGLEENLGILIVLIPSIIFGSRRIIQNAERSVEAYNKLKEIKNRK